MELTPIYTTHNGRTHIALQHDPCRTVVALGSFPTNCPRAAIKDWHLKQTIKAFYSHSCIANHTTMIAAF